MSSSETFSVVEVAELAKHTSKDSCWTAIHGRVYDLTPFLKLHPGGPEAILVEAGKDATEVFEEAGHSDSARKKSLEYFVGVLEGFPEEVATKNIPYNAEVAKYQRSSGSTSSSPLYFVIAVILALIFGFVCFQIGV